MFIIDLDIKVINKIQDWYLVLLDRYDIMIGELIVIYNFLDFIFRSFYMPTNSWLAFFCTGFVFAYGIFMSRLQRSGRFLLINSMAKSFRESYMMRSFLISFNLSLSFILYPTIVGIVGDNLIYFSFCYILCLKVRKRDADRFRKTVTVGKMVFAS